MADGKHKNGVAITVTYQAANEATGKTVTMDIYDEAHLLDAPKSVAAMTEIVATGRYYATFTPDAEGDWTAVMKNTTDSNGAVIKFYPVGGHNIDGIGDDIAALNNLSAANIATELGTYDAATGTEIATVDGKIDTLDTVADAIKTVTDAESGVKAAVVALNDLAVGDLNNVSTTQIATELETYDGVKKSELDAVQGGSETLETIKTAVDSISSPAMVG